MTHRSHDKLRRWLTAELQAPPDGRSRDAETALFRLFQALPGPAPSPGFADRVLARIGKAPAAAPVVAWLKWPVAVCMLVAGLSCFLWWPVAVELLGGLSWSAPVELIGHAVHAVGAGLRRGFAFWELLSRIGGAFGKVASQPTVLAALAGAVAVATLAFRALLDLTSRERSWTHV